MKEGPSVKFQDSFERRVASPNVARGVVLLIHGITASPREMEPLAEHLVSQKFNVIVPRLPGHEGDFNTLRRTRAELWIAEAEQLFANLRRSTPNLPIFVVGASFGALLALHLTATYRTEIVAVALVAPAVKLRSSLDEYALQILSLFPESFLDRLPVSTKKKRLMNYLTFPREAYEQHSLGALARLMQIRKRLFRRSRDIVTPVLIIQDPNDHLLSRDAWQLIVEKISSPCVKVSLFPGGQHELTLGHCYRDVNREIGDFFESVEQCESDSCHAK